MEHPKKYPLPERDPNWEPSEVLRGKVRYLAYLWSRDRPDYQDDLLQEALLAIWLKGETEAPLNHQLRTARERMWVVRQQGKSVDGRLNRAFRRPQVWQVLSMELMVYGASHISRPVEDYVVTRITVEEIFTLLTPPERECLCLVYQGFTQPEISRRTGYSERRIQRTMRAIREKVWPYLHNEEAVARVLESEQLRYAETVQAATNTDAPWTEDEDRVILERAGDPAYEVALTLGRTLWAVLHRRSRLRKRIIQKRNAAR